MNQSIMGKRFFDILLSVLGLIILVPFFLVIAVLIKLNSQGPVFYLQERIGKDRRPFKLFKFRSMRTDADKGNAITVGARDSRITSIGYYLRKFKLDELPQLINVLKGDMSLVGPRPEVKKFVDLYSEDQLKVLSVRPGLTDIASIEYRNENELLEGKADPIDFYIQEIMPKKLHLNLQYIASQSIFLDFKIIFKTIFSVFK